MISEAESGLSTDDYNALLAARAEPVRSFVIERYNLTFSNESDFDRQIGNLFDAQVSGDYIVRVWIEADGVLYSERSLDGAIWDDPVAVDDTLGDSPITLVQSGSTLRAFYFIDAELTYCDSTDDGATWDTPVPTGNVDYDPIPFMLAASTLVGVHFVVNNGEGISLFGRYDGNNSWATVLSDIHWPSQITGLSALETDEATHSEALAITGAFQPHIGNSVEDGALAQTLYFRGGVACFSYIGTRWSSHIQVETFDDWTEWQRRDNARITKMNGYYFMTTYGSDGTEQYSQRAIYIYKSKDGLNWSRPILAHVATAYGAKLLALGDYVFLVDASACWSSFSTAFTEYVPAALTQDITPYIDLNGGANLTFSSMASAELSLINDNGVLDDTLVLSDADLLLRVSLGYIVGTGIDRHAVSIPRSIMLVERVAPMRQGANNVIVVSCRGVMARLSDAIKSPILIERQGQTLGVDEYTDQTKTGYGGLRHTAVQKGSFRTDGTQLFLSSNNQQGVANSTFETEIDNGFLQVKVDWSKNGKKEYVGIIFWAFDSSNFWSAVYNTVTSLIEIWRYSAGTKTVITSGVSSPGFSLGGSNWMRVRTYYNQIDVDISLDGFTWTNHLTYNTDSEETLSVDDVAQTAPIVLRGSEGLLGKGYSPQDTWQLPDWNLPPTFYVPGPPWDGWHFPPYGGFNRMPHTGPLTHPVTDMRDLSWAFGAANNGDLYRIRDPFKANRRVELVLPRTSFRDVAGTPVGISFIDLDPFRSDYSMYSCVLSGIVPTMNVLVFQLNDILNVPVVSRIFVSPTYDEVRNARIHVSPRFPGRIQLIYRARIGSTWRLYSSIRASYTTAFSTPTKIMPDSGSPSDPDTPHWAPTGGALGLGFGLSPNARSSTDGMGLVAGWKHPSETYDILRSNDYGKTFNSTPLFTVRGAPGYIVFPAGQAIGHNDVLAYVAANDTNSHSKSMIVRYNNGTITPIAPSLPVIGYVGMENSNDFWGSTDFGFRVAPGDSQRLYLRSNYGQLWRSADSGDNWTNISANLPSPAAFHCIEVTPYNPDHLLVWGWDEAIDPVSVVHGWNLWASRDAGSTFETVFGTDNSHRVHTPLTSSEWYLFCVRYVWWR